MNDHGDTILTTLRQIIRAVDLHSKRLTKRYGLTGPQLLVLKELHGKPDLTIGEVARNVSLSQATVTAILDRLERLDYLHRSRNTKDKRKVNVVLTEKAESVMHLSPSLLQEDFIGRLEKLQDWEQHQLISSLQRIASMMKAEDIKAPPVLDSDPVLDNDALLSHDKDAENYFGE